MNSRFAIVLGATFAIVGAIYIAVQHLEITSTDLEGGVLLLILGIAMAFGFTVLVRGSRDL
jgi:small neutral amino acid transporter SnatA (MarC family)